MEIKKGVSISILAFGIIGLSIIFIVTLILMLINYDDILSYINKNWWFKIMIILSISFTAYLMIWLKKYKLNVYANIEWVFGLTICYLSLSSIHDSKGFMTFFGGFFVVIRGTENWFSYWQKK